MEHHRDGQYYPAFRQLIDAAEVTRVPLPPRSPNLNAYAERWVRFETARSAPAPIVEALRKMFPDLEFQLNFRFEDDPLKHLPGQGRTSIVAAAIVAARNRQ